MRGDSEPDFLGPGAVSPILGKVHWSGGAEEALRDALEMEKAVTASIKSLVEACDGPGDYHAADWYKKNEILYFSLISPRIFCVKKMYDKAPQKDISRFSYSNILILAAKKPLRNPSLTAATLIAATNCFIAQQKAFRRLARGAAGGPEAAVGHGQLPGRLQEGPRGAGGLDVQPAARGEAAGMILLSTS